MSSRVLPGFEVPAKPPSLYRHAAVALYRKTCKYKPNQLQRELIEETVGDEPKALSLYEEVLVQFMTEGRPPQRVDWTLERFVEALPPVRATLAPREEQEPLTDEQIRRNLGYHGPDALATDERG